MVKHTRHQLESLPLEERRAIQRQHGLVTKSFLIKQHAENKHGKRSFSRRKKEKMQESHQQPHEQENTHRRKVVEEFFENMGSGEPILKTAKKTAVQAAVWTPVIFGVGLGLLRIGKKMWMGT